MLIPVTGGLTGCSTHKTPQAPKAAATVNPVIEQAIQRQVEVQNQGGIPDIRNAPTRPEEEVSAREIAAEKVVLMEQAQELAQDISRQRDQLTAEERLEQKAADLKQQIRNDQKALNAETSLPPIE
ncbi:MAG: hypothetical protein AAF723_03880 [Pseudomonadota bacterium]